MAKHAEVGMAGTMRFTVEDEAGGLRAVEQRSQRVSTACGRVRTVPFYYLESGESVNRIHADLFVVVGTGERLRSRRDGAS